MIQRISLRAVCLGEDLRQLAPLAQRLGYAALQLDLRIGALKLDELSASGRREVRHLLSASNLDLESLRMQLPAEGLAAADLHDRSLWAISKAIDAAAALNVSHLCIDVGRLPVAKGDSLPKPTAKPANAGLIIIPEPAPAPVVAEETPEDTQAWPGVDAILREIGGKADRAGVMLALSSELSSFASLKRAINHAACPMFGVDLDPVSVLRDAWSLERVLDEIGANLLHVRARDAVRGNALRTQPAAIGRGNTDWRTLLALLDTGGFSGWIAIDTADLPNRAGEAQRAINALA